jgi:hypothetical protein
VPAIKADDRYASAVEQVRAGKGFLTTGPALLFEVDGKTPGSVVLQGSRNWSIDLISVRPVERVEIIVNGRIVQTLKVSPATVASATLERSICRGRVDRRTRSRWRNRVADHVLYPLCSYTAAVDQPDRQH